MVLIDNNNYSNMSIHELNIYRYIPGAFNPSEKYESVGIFVPNIANIWKNEKCSKPPTRFPYVGLESSNCCQSNRHAFQMLWPCLLPPICPAIIGSTASIANHQPARKRTPLIQHSPIGIPSNLHTQPTSSKSFLRRHCQLTYPKKPTSVHEVFITSCRIPI